jgi:glycosyltransferase involved in cell wall biosynthesis
MKKYIILIPIYNDRESLTKLIEDINSEIEGINSEISVVVINDASSQQIIDEYQNTENISSIEIINMKENRGHTRCIASGLKYIYEKKEFDYVIPMDGDGEDRPEEIKNFIQLAEQSNDQSIVGERVKRSESLFFKFCYQFHKFLTLAFTGQSIRFGNFTCLSKSTIEKMLKEKATWNSFSGSLKKTDKNLLSIPSIRGTRYFGPSKMSFFNLLKHSLSIISIFRKTVLIRSAFFYSFLYYVN